MNVYHLQGQERGGEGPKVSGGTLGTDFMLRASASLSIQDRMVLRWGCWLGGVPSTWEGPPDERPPPPSHLSPPPAPACPLPRASVEAKKPPAPPLPFIPDRKAQLGDWTWGFGADVCELAGGWESGDLLPVLTAACSSPAPHPLPPEDPGPLPLCCHPRGQGERGRGQLRQPEGWERLPQPPPLRSGPHWELLKTPDLFSPLLCHPCLWVERTKVEWNQRQATSGAAVGPQHPSCVDGTQGRDRFWEPAGRMFLKPFRGGRPQGEPQPEPLSALSRGPRSHTRTAPAPVSTGQTRARGPGQPPQERRLSPHLTGHRERVAFAQPGAVLGPRAKPALSSRGSKRALSWAQGSGRRR